MSLISMFMRMEIGGVYKIIDVKHIILMGMSWILQFLAEIQCALLWAVGLIMLIQSNFVCASSHINILNLGLLKQYTQSIITFDLSVRFAMQKSYSFKYSVLAEYIVQCVYIVMHTAIQFLERFHNSNWQTTDSHSLVVFIFEFFFAVVVAVAVVCWSPCQSV